MIFLAYNLNEKYKTNEVDSRYSFYSSPYTNLEYNEDLWIGDYSNIHSYILENIPYYVRCFENRNKSNSKDIETSLFYWRDLRYKYIPKIISVESDIWNAWEDIITTEFNYLITKIYNEVYTGFLTKTLTVGTLKIKKLLDERNIIYNDSIYSKNDLSVLNNRINSYYNLFYLDNLDLIIKTRISSDLYSGKINIEDYTLLKIYTKLDYIENLVFLRQIQNTKEITTYLSNIFDSNLELYYSHVLQDLIFDTNSPNSNNLICSGLINFYPSLGVRISAKSIINRLCNYSSDISNSEYYKATSNFENVLTLENKNSIYRSIWKDLYLTNFLGIHKEYNENSDDSIDYKKYLRSYLYDINYEDDTYYYDISNGSSSKKERIHKLNLENLLAYKTQHYDYYIKKNLLRYDEYKKDEYGEYIRGVYNHYDEEPIKNIIKYISSVTRVNTLLNLNKLLYKDYYNYSLMNIEYYNNIKNIVSKYSSNFGLTLKTALSNRNNSIYQVKYVFYCDKKYYDKFNSVPDKVNSKLLIYLVKYSINGEKLVGQENTLTSIINPNTGEGINIGTYSISDDDTDRELNELEGKYTLTTYYFLTEHKLINFHSVAYYNNSIDIADNYLYSITDLKHFIDVLPFARNSLGNITLEDYKVIESFEYQESKLLFRLCPKYNLINNKLSPLFNKTITTMKTINTNTISNSHSNLDYNTQITNCTSNDLLRNDLGFINYSNDKKEYITSSYLELYRPLIENTLKKEDIENYYKEVCKVYGYNQNIDNGVRDLNNETIKEKHYDEQYDYNDSTYILRFTNDSSIRIEPTDYYFDENIDTYNIPKNNTLTGFKLLPCRELYQINNNNAFKLVSGYQLDNSLDYKDNIDKDLDDLEINEDYNSNWIWNKIGLGFCYRIKFSLLQNEKLDNNKICLLSQPLKDKDNNITRNINNIFNIILEKGGTNWKLKVNLPLGFNEIPSDNKFNNTILCKNIIFDLCSIDNTIFDLTLNYKITSETNNYSKCKLYYSLISNNDYLSDEKEFDIKFIEETNSIELDNEIVLENAIKLKHLGDIIRYNKDYSLKTCDIILFSIGYGYDSNDLQNFRIKEKYNKYIEYDNTIQDFNYSKYLEYGYLSLFGSIYDFELYCYPKENLIHYDYMLNNYDEILRLSYSYYNINFKSLHNETDRTKKNYQITKLITTINNIDLVKDPFYNLIDEDYDIWTFENKINIDFDNSRFRTLHYLAENTIFDSFNEISNNIVSNFNTIVKYQNKDLFKINEDQIYSFIGCELKDIVYDNTSLTKFSYTDNNYIKKLKDLEYLDITLPYCISDTSSNTEINLNLENSLTYKFNNYNFINYIAKASNVDLIYYDNNITNKLAYNNVYVIKTNYSLTGFNNSGILSPFYICEFSKRKIDEIGTLDTYENSEYENKKIYEISSLNLSNIIVDNSLLDFLNPINYYTEINIPFSIRDNNNIVRQYNKTYGIRTIQDGTYKFKMNIPFKILDNTFTSNIFYLLTELMVIAKTEYYDSKNIIDEIEEIPTEYRYNKENGINYAFKSYNNIKYIKDENNLRKAKTTITLLDKNGNVLNYKKIRDKYVITSNVIFDISLNPYELKEIKFSLYNSISKKYAKDDNNIIKLNTNKEYNILLDFNSLCYDLEVLDEDTKEYKSLKKYKDNIKDFYILKGLIDNKYFSTKLSSIVGSTSHFDIIKYDSNNKQYYLSCGYAYDLENNTWLKSVDANDDNYIYLGDPNSLNTNNYLFKNHNALFSYSSVSLDNENLKKLFAYNIINYLVVRKSLDYNINKNTFNYFNNDNVLTTIGIDNLDDESNSKEYTQFAINNFDEEDIILKQAKELTDNINANLNEIIMNTANIIYGISNFSFNFRICEGFEEGFDTYFYNRHTITYTQKIPSFIYNSNYNNQKIEYKNLEYNKLNLTSNSLLNSISYNLQNLIANEDIDKPYEVYFNNTSNIISLTQINSTKIVINRSSIITSCVKSLNNPINKITLKANNGKEIILYESDTNSLDKININSSLKDLVLNYSSISINDIEINIIFNSSNIENSLIILDSFKILNYTISKNIMIGDTNQNLALKETENIENSIVLEPRFDKYNKINCLTYGNEDISLFNKFLVYNSDGDVVYQNYEMYKEGNNNFVNPFNANLKIKINNCEISTDKDYLENKNLKVFEKYYLNNRNIYFGYSISLNAYHKIFTHNKLIYNKKDNLELLKDISTLNLSKEIEKVEIKDIANLSTILKNTIERDIKNMFVNIDIDDFYINNLSISGHSWNNKKLEDIYKFNTIILAEYFINTIKDENDNTRIESIVLDPYFIFNFPSIEYDSKDSLLFEVINNDTKI